MMKAHPIIIGSRRPPWINHASVKPERNTGKLAMKTNIARDVPSFLFP